METQNLFEKIIVPLDGSHWAERALPHAEQIAAGSNSELIIVYVYRPGGAEHAANVALAGHKDQITLARDDAEAYMRGILGKISSHKVNCRTHIIEGSNAARLICDFVNDEGADLVVMPTVGHNRLMRMFMGDLTTQVRGCINACLLLVRGNMEAEWDKESAKALEQQAAAQANTKKPESAMPKLDPEQLIIQLEMLKNAGVLTDEEFHAKRDMVLSR